MGYLSTAKPPQEMPDEELHAELDRQIAEEKRRAESGSAFGRGGQHNLPHLHAGFSGQEAVVDLSGNIIEGEIPKGKMKLLLAWMEIHREELEANWKLLCDGESAFKIEPLK